MQIPSGTTHLPKHEVLSLTVHDTDGMAQGLKGSRKNKRLPEHGVSRAPLESMDVTRGSLADPPSSSQQV